MKLSSYLDRIGFRETPQADLPTLKKLHSLHLMGISYENLDVQLERALDLSISDAHHKIVANRRGGLVL